MLSVVQQIFIFIFIFLVRTTLSAETPRKIKNKDTGSRGDYAISVIVLRNNPIDMLYDQNIIDNYYFEEGIPLLLNCHRNHINRLQWTVSKDGVSLKQLKEVNDTNYIIKIENTNRYFDGVEFKCHTNEYNQPKTLILRYNGTHSKTRDEVLNYNVGDTVSQPCGKKQDNRSNETVIVGTRSNQKTRYNGKNGDFMTDNKNGDYIYLKEYTNTSKYISQSGVIFDHIGKNDNGTEITCTKFKMLGKQNHNTRKGNGLLTKAETCEIEISRFIIKIKARNNDSIDAGNTGVDGNTSAQPIDAGEDDTVPVYRSPVLIGIITGVIIVAGLYAVFIFIKIWRHKRMIQTHIYAEPSQVVYAQIQLDNTNNPPPVQNTNKEPYARIIGVLAPRKACDSTPLALPPRNKETHENNYATLMRSQ